MNGLTHQERIELGGCALLGRGDTRIADELGHGPSDPRKLNQPRAYPMVRFPIQFPGSFAGRITLGEARAKNRRKPIQIATG